MSADSNDPWYYANFDISSGNDYSGYGFYYVVSNLVSGGTGVFTGTISGQSYSFTGSAYTDFNNMVVGTLRSRGIAAYNNSTNPDYQVTGTTNVILDFNGVYSGASISPYSPFGVSGVTYEGNLFSFKISIKRSNCLLIEGWGLCLINKVRLGFKYSELLRIMIPLFLSNSDIAAFGVNKVSGGNWTSDSTFSNSFRSLAKEIADKAIEISVTTDNETGENITNDTAYTASFIIL